MYLLCIPLEASLLPLPMEGYRDTKPGVSPGTPYGGEVYRYQSSQIPRCPCTRSILSSGGGCFPLWVGAVCGAGRCDGRPGVGSSRVGRVVHVYNTTPSTPVDYRLHPPVHCDSLLYMYAPPTTTTPSQECMVVSV